MLQNLGGTLMEETRRYLNMIDIPVDIVNEKELKKGSVIITIKKRG